VFVFRKIAIMGCLWLQLTVSLSAQIKDESSEALITQLGDKDVEKRRDAVYELVRRGDHNAPVLLALGKATADSDTQIQVQALTGLARAGKASEPTIPELIGCLNNRDDQVRYRAAAALGAIGNASIEPIVAYWEKASTSSKIAAAQSLAIVGPAANSTVKLLSDALDGKEGLPRYAAEALVAIAPQDESMMLRIAEHADAQARKVGISALAALGAPSAAAIKKLQSAAGDSEPKIRETAIVAVAKSSLPVGEKSMLIEAALVDSEESVRAAAIVAMRKAKLPAAEFSQRIADRLKNAEGEAAEAIIKAIGAQGSDAVGTLPALLQVVNKKGIDQQLVSETLASLGATVVPDLLATIEKQPANEPVLSQALGLIGEPAVEALVRGLSSELDLVRLAAARALGGVRPMNKALLERLVVAAADKSASVREIAIASLVTAGTDADFAKETILKATEDVDPKVRAAATKSLATFKFNEDQMQVGLERGLGDVSSDVRAGTLKTLSDLPKLVKSRLPQLVVLVGDADANVRAMAMRTLGKLDKTQADEIVVAACAKALSDQDHAVRIAATETVKSLAISDASVLLALSNNLIDDPELLRVTLEAVAGFGDKAASMIPAISRLAAHEKVALRIAAINALAGIEKNSKQLSDQLTESLNDKEWEVRRVAGVALGKLGAEAKNAVPKLFQLMASEEDRDFASSALKEINTAPIEAIPLLMEKLDSEERRTAFYAVTLLGKIGPPAVEALPKLEEMLAKPGGITGRSDFRKKFLVEAIAAIKGDAKPEDEKK
jgi:HEAT repeat protein